MNDHALHDSALVDAPLVVAVNQRLDGITEKLHDIHVSLESVRVSLAGLSSASEDHEQRLRRIERWQQRLSPAAAVLTFLLGAAVTAVVERAITN